MLSNSRSASPAFPSTPSSPRPKLPFLPLGGIRWGLNGHGAHDGPRSGRPPPRPGVPPCRGATWPGTHPGTDRGPATWWLQPTGLVWYRPVNTKINITLHFLLGKNTLTLWCIERSFFGLIQVCGFVFFDCTNSKWGTFNSLWPQRVQTAPNYEVVWCGVCVMLHGIWSVCGLNQLLSPVSFRSPPVFPLTGSFFFFFFYPLPTAVSCDPDEPASWFAHMEEAGFQKVPEDDSTTASRVSCLWELHWDKLDLSAVLVC